MTHVTLLTVSLKIMSDNILSDFRQLKHLSSYPLIFMLSLQ